MISLTWILDQLVADDGVLTEVANQQFRAIFIVVNSSGF